MQCNSFSHGIFGNMDLGYLQTYVLCPCSSLNLIHRDIFRIFSNNRFGYFPDLDEIVLSSAAHNPWLIQVPGEIRHAVGVTTVHKQPAAGISTVHNLGTLERTYSSGGPSSWSSGNCSSPTLLRSQNITRRSSLPLAKTASSNGCHASDVTMSL